MKLIALLSVAALFTGCVTSYHMQIFSNDVEALEYNTVTKLLGPESTPSVETSYEGLFKARDYETAAYFGNT